jgi:DNA-binding MarR family transcriptional regulator
VELEESLGMLVALADKRLQQIVSLEAQKYDITPQQFWVVLLLDGGALDSVQSVGRRIGIDKPAASRLVEALVTLGWARYGDSGDSRRRPVELTARGHRQAARFREVAFELSAAIEEGVSPAQRAAISQGLKRMIANLDGALEKRVRDRSSKSRS